MNFCFGLSVFYEPKTPLNFAIIFGWGLAGKRCREMATSSLEKVERESVQDRDSVFSADFWAGGEGRGGRGRGGSIWIGGPIIVFQDRSL
jgi:hypothetical protein